MNDHYSTEWDFFDQPPVASATISEEGLLKTRSLRASEDLGAWCLSRILPCEAGE